MRKLFFTLLLALPLSALAQNTPVGKWTTMDDATHKPKSVVQIQENANGTLSGKVLEILQSDKGPNPVCDGCDGAKHNQPVKGMEILWGVKKHGNVWEDGKILDPKNGKVYSVKLRPMEGGKKMEVRGFLGFSLLGRTQVWVRQ